MACKKKRLDRLNLSLFLFLSVGVPVLRAEEAEVKTWVQRRRSQRAAPSWRVLKTSPGCLMLDGRRALRGSGVESRTSQV